MKRLIFLIAAVLLSTAQLYSQWVQTNGPNGGSCESMYSYNGYLFAVSGGSVIYRSSDNGDNWSLLNTFSISLNDVTFTSQGSYLFLATSGNGVFRSSDNGVTWTAVNTGFPYSIYPVENIVTSGQYLICGEYRMYRSSNFGNSWDSCTNGMATPLSIYEISVIGNKVYAGTTKGAYVSTNDGSSWTSINNGITTLAVNKISSDGINLYAAASNGVYKSTNEGALWFALNNGLPAAWYYDVIYDGTYLFSTTLFGRYRSSNGGQSWESCINGLTSLASVKFYISGTRLFSLLWGGAGIQYTTNHGSNWEVSNNGFYGFWSTNITVKDNMIYTCGYQQGLAMSSNDGAPWQYIWNGMIDRYINSVVANNSFVFISTLSKGVLKTSNQGINWVQCTNGIDTLDIKRLFAFDDVVFAYKIYDSWSYRTTDNGVSWSGFYTPITVESIARIGEVFIAGNSSMETGGLIRSTNKGANWTSVIPSYLPGGIVAKDSAFYFYNYNGLYKSTNLGINWVQVPSDLSAGGSKLYVVDNKLVCLSGVNIYTSSNNGTNWISKSQGLPYLQGIGALAVKGTNVFLCTSGRGVWKISKADLLPVENISTEVPSAYSLKQNYPNPFNPVTKIQYSITKNGFVKLVVFDALGREVETLVNEVLQPGTYETSFDGSTLNSGVYFYKLTSGDFTSVKKMMMVK